MCGLSGIKTSQGRVPNGGPKPTGSGLLTVKGPMTRRIRDAAFVLDQCVGAEPTDIFSLPAPTEPWAPPARWRAAQGGDLFAHHGDHEL